MLKTISIVIQYTHKKPCNKYVGYQFLLCPTDLLHGYDPPWNAGKIRHVGYLITPQWETIVDFSEKWHFLNLKFSWCFVIIILLRTFQRLFEVNILIINEMREGLRQEGHDIVWPSADINQWTRLCLMHFRFFMSG